MDCSICCGTFNKSNRSKISCKLCPDNIQDFACRTCAQTFILNSDVDASCMFCKNIWDREFLVYNLTPTFVNNKYKLHRENILLDRQIALLPDTQQYAIQKKLFNDIELQIISEKNELYRMSLLYIKQKKKIRDLEQSKHAIFSNKDKENETKKTFTFKCPIQNCNGFLDNKFFCAICNNNICKHCMEQKLDNHICDEQKKSSLALIKKDTKPCPNCGEMIFKINGCDQMYCITCKTPFSWITGIIDKGNIHNPEYYRWLRENGQIIPRDPLDVPFDPCANIIPTQRQLLSHIRTILSLNNDSETHVLNMLRLYHHIQHKNTDFNNLINHHQLLLKDLRADFILNIIDKSSWKNKLQFLDKKYTKLKLFNDTWNTISIVLLQHIHNILSSNDRLIIFKLIQTSFNILHFANNSFKITAKIFNCKPPKISNSFNEIY